MCTATHRIPATSANLGPGYDCLGVALRLYNEVTVRSGASQQSPHPMAIESAQAFARRADVDLFEFDWSVKGDVPMSRGLGSSVTVRLGLLHGLNELAGSILDANDLYRLCVELEGHPDNAAPAAFGGFTVAGADATFSRFKVDPALQFVVFIPEMQMLTKEARAVLPAAIPHEDAVRNVANACRIAAAMAAGEYEKLRGVFDDFLHQPYRASLMPCLPEVIRAGVAAGALGGYLSGSGSCMACVTLKQASEVGSAMAQAAAMPGELVILQPDNEGVRKITI